MSKLNNLFKVANKVQNKYFEKKAGVLDYEPVSTISSYLYYMAQEADSLAESASTVIKYLTAVKNNYKSLIGSDSTPPGFYDQFLSHLSKIKDATEEWKNRPNIPRVLDESEGVSKIQKAKQIANSPEFKQAQECSAKYMAVLQEAKSYITAFEKSKLELESSYKEVAENVIKNKEPKWVRVCAVIANYKKFIEDNIKIVSGSYDLNLKGILDESKKNEQAVKSYKLKQMQQGTINEQDDDKSNEGDEEELPPPPPPPRRKRRSVRPAPKAPQKRQRVSEPDFG